MSVRPSWARPEVCRRSVVPPGAPFSLGLGTQQQQQQGHLADPDMALREPPKPPLLPRVLACACVLWALGSVVSALVFVGKTIQRSGVSLDDLNPMGSAGEDSGCMLVLDTTGLRVRPCHLEVAGLAALERTSAKEAGAFDSLVVNIEKMSPSAYVLRTQPCDVAMQQVFESERFHAEIMQELRALRRPTHFGPTHTNSSTSRVRVTS